MSKKETWIVTLNTNIGCEHNFGSIYEPEFEKKFFAFDSFEEAKTKAFELIKSYAFSENSMFDGEGGIKRWETFIEKCADEEDDEYYDEDDEYDEDADEDEKAEVGELNLSKAYNIFNRWLNGEQIDLSDDNYEPYYFEPFCYEIEIIDGKKLIIQNASDFLPGPRFLYGWIITTDMMNITEPGNYSLYIRDNFDWDEDDPSILQVEIALANDYSDTDKSTESAPTKDSKSQASDKPRSNKAKKSSKSAEKKKPITDIKAANIGDHILFGKYYQSNSETKEEIEWRVLDKKDDKILLLSERALDAQNYNNKYKGTTWEKCSLRNWLNETFINEAFSADEQMKIVDTKLKAEANSQYGTKAGNDTTDKVFPLSTAEAEEYLKSEMDRICVPTAYAIENGGRALLERAYGKDVCIWWLRSPGRDSAHVAAIQYQYFDTAEGTGVRNQSIYVRPALWIEI